MTSFKQRALAATSAISLVVTQPAFIGGAVMLPTSFVLVNCTGQTPAQNLQTAAKIAAAIATGVQALAPALGALGLSPEASAQVTKYAGVVATIAAQIEANPGSTSASQLQQIEDAVNQIIAAASTVTALPVNVRTVLGALSIALPMLEAAIGILLPPSPTPTPAVAFQKSLRLMLLAVPNALGNGGTVIDILNGAPGSLKAAVR